MVMNTPKPWSNAMPWSEAKKIEYKCKITGLTKQELRELVDPYFNYENEELEIVEVLVEKADKETKMVKFWLETKSDGMDYCTDSSL
jgi:predicted subunit of tRNA(5-methylaminomethyl-2-thiouridylate) methyltransferase